MRLIQVGENPPRFIRPDLVSDVRASDPSGNRSVATVGGKEVYVDAPVAELVAKVNEALAVMDTPQEAWARFFRGK